MQQIINYFITFFIFLLVDSFWLLYVAKELYSKNIGHLLAKNVNLWSAGLFYLLNIIGIMIFALNPALQKNSILMAFIYGAFYGFFTYSTYDLTNLATLKDWPVLITVIDILWGTFLTSMVTGISYYIIRKFF